MSTFKPLLAERKKPDITKLRYPVLVSPKLDGIRCVKMGGKALTRKLKPIKNDYIRTWVEANLPDGIDGELLVRAPRVEGQGAVLTFTHTPLLPFKKVSSAVSSKAGVPDFLFMAFDVLRHNPETGELYADEPFVDRFHVLNRVAENRPVLWEGVERLMVVPHVLVDDPEELQAVVDSHLALGYEGTMIRDPHGVYKYGRSTMKEGILLKLKVFEDDEAQVIGAVEQMHNENEATRDEVGNVKRSTAKAGLVGAGKLGAFQCRMEDGTEFEVGSGFDDEEKTSLWDAWTRYGFQGLPFGHILKFKHQPPPGGRKAGEAPRFPVFLGWRDEDD